MWSKSMTTDSSVKSKNTDKSQLSNRRDEFFQALKKVFYDLNGENLPIYGVVSVYLVNIAASC